MKQFKILSSILLMVCCASLLTFTSCKKNKQPNSPDVETSTTSESQKDTTSIVFEGKADKLTQQVVKATLANENSFKVINVSKMETHIDLKGKSFTVNCGVKIFSNQLIEVSIRPMMGIEMFRIHFTPSKFQVFNKFDKVYCENNYDYFRYEFGLPIDYDDIEAMLIGRIFAFGYPNTEKVMPHAFQTVAGDSTYTLNAINKVDRYTHRIELNNEYFVTKVALKGNTADVYSFTYDNYKKVSNVMIPTSITAKYARGTYPTILDFKITKVNVNDKSQPTQVDMGRYIKQNCSKLLSF